MGKGLLEYAQEHPAQEEPQEQQAIKDTARAYYELKDRAEQAAQLKENITLLFEQGFDPQIILYWTLELIGLLTDNMEWAQAQQEHINSVYADLAQQSFIANNEAIAADRRAQQRKDYYTKLRARLLREIRHCGQIQTDLANAVKSLDDLNPQDPEEILNS